MSRPRFAALVVTLILLLATVATAAACGGNEAGPVNGVIVGMVTLGPLEPVAQQGASPAVRPYEATIGVARHGGGVIATVRSGADGRFTLRLPAGTYELLPRTPAGQLLPVAPPVNVVVANGVTTTVTIAYDTGIR
jgi:hypothetical protein